MVFQILDVTPHFLQLFLIGFDCLFKLVLPFQTDSLLLHQCFPGLLCAFFDFMLSLSVSQSIFVELLL
jgi:hypothetical protein